MRRRRELLGLAICSAGTLWYTQGCHTLDESNRMRLAEPIPGLTAQAAPMTFSDKPSVHGIDRSDWPRVDLFVSRDDLATRPVYWKSFVFGRRYRVRADGAYPTIDTALDTTTSWRNAGAQYLEMLFDPVLQGACLAFMPIQALTIHMPRRLNYGPHTRYDLVPGELRPVEIFPVPTAQTSVEPTAPVVLPEGGSSSGAAPGVK